MRRRQKQRLRWLIRLRSLTAELETSIVLAYNVTGRRKSTACPVQMMLRALLRSLASWSYVSPSTFCRGCLPVHVPLTALEGTTPPACLAKRARHATWAACNSDWTQLSPEGQTAVTETINYIEQVTFFFDVYEEHRDSKQCRRSRT